MEFSAKEPLAMILPLPVKPAIDPKRFRFISLEAYPSFFEDMNLGFPVPAAANADPFAARFGVSKSALEVVSVGSFDASFVPTLRDFKRLDRRFQIEGDVWRSVPGYVEMGFAVFKLKPGKQRVHPMSFSFPRRNPDSLFFPTLHIHDGSFHQKEEFDHVIYTQGNGDRQPDTRGWAESAGWASQFMNTKLTADILTNGAHLYRQRLRGELPNQDTLLRID